MASDTEFAWDEWFREFQKTMAEPYPGKPTHRSRSNIKVCAGNICNLIKGLLRAPLRVVPMTLLWDKQCNFPLLNYGQTKQSLGKTPNPFTPPTKHLSKFIWSLFGLEWSYYLLSLFLLVPSHFSSYRIKISSHKKLTLNFQAFPEDNFYFLGLF